MTPRLLVVGSINMDLAARVRRAPEAGETVIGTSYAFSPGGKGGNAAFAAARLGGEVRFCGCVGRDDYGKALRRALLEEGVSDENLREDEAAPTGMALIFVEDSGQNRIAVYPGANMRLDVAQLHKAFERPVDAVLLQLEITHEAIFAAARMAAQRGAAVVLDAGPAQQFPIERVEGLTILSPNETETQALCGIMPSDEQSCRAACRALRGRAAAKYVVLKLGGRGCYVDGEGQSYLVPAFPVKAVDTTAAGDTFTGALALHYLRTGDMAAAARYACAAGALCCQRAGALASLPTSAQVAEFLQDR